MALGGGNFVLQNKILPGSYINVVSAANANSNNGKRGIAAIPLEFSWGPDEEIFKMESSEFDSNAIKVFGYQSDDDALKYVREIFKHATTVYFYKLNSNGKKASNDLADAKYKGVRGNDLKIVVQQNADNEGIYDVSTYLGTLKVDTQTVASASELMANDYVTFKSEAALSTAASLPLSGGTNGETDGANHRAFLDKMEAYSFNTTGTMSTDEDIKKVYAEWTKRMRNEVGIKFQCVLFNYAGDDESIINVKNSVDLVAWTIGVEAGCEINSSCTNMIYDGEFEVNTSYTQYQLENAIGAGEFVFHKVGNNVRVLTDINSLVTTTETKGEIFKNNQTIRVIDQLANKSAEIFNTKYIGKVLNDDNGRASFWAELLEIHNELQTIGAIENFNNSDITVAQGDKKGAVVVTDLITVTGTMEQLYMTVTIQ